MGVSITNLIETIGIDNVGVQFLDSCATNFTWSEKRKTSKVTFETDQRFGMNGLDKVGIVVWLPRDEVMEVMRKAREAKSEVAG